MSETPEQWKKRAEEEGDVYRDTPDYPNKTLELSLPLPPSVNSMYANTRNGGRRLTSHAKKYVNVSRALINQAITEQKWIKQKRHVWLYIDLVFYMPDRRVRDSHNMLKLLLDVLEGVVYDNDYSVLPRIQSVEYDKEAPRVEARVITQTQNNRNKGLKTTAKV